MLISVHIPKCGGISFEHVLRKIFRKGLWRCYEADLDRGGPGPVAIPPGIRCIHGHFRSDAFDALAPGADLITWLRHPVQRVVSNYFHFKRHPDPANRSCRAMMEKGLSLEAFAELDGMRDLATRFFGGKPASAFRFIGITERFCESLDHFTALFGWNTPRWPPMENVNPERRGEIYSLPEGIYRHILSLNAADLVAYESASRRLDAAIGSNALKVAR